MPHGSGPTQTDFIIFRYCVMDAYVDVGKGSLHAIEEWVERLWTNCRCTVGMENDVWPKQLLNHCPIRTQQLHTKNPDNYEAEHTGN